MSNDGLTGPKSTQKLTEHSSASSTLNSSVDSITLDNGNFTLSLHAEYLSVNGISTRGDAVVIESRVGNGPVDVRISPDETESYCCGLLHRKKSRFPPQISYYDVLSAQLEAGDLEIGYAEETKKDEVKPSVLRFAVQPSQQDTVKAWIERLLDLAYSKSQRQKRIKVLINPHGGRGKGEELYNTYIAPIFHQADCKTDVEVTQHVGHAREIAQKLDIDAWDVIACASGDGTAHEVFNGLALQEHPCKALSKIAVVQLPCGSGNAMSVNILGTSSPSIGALATVKGIKSSLDLASITQGDKRYISFLSQAVGIVAESDIGTDNIRWMGPARFELGYLMRVLGKTIYPAEIWAGIDTSDKASIREGFAKYANISANFQPQHADSNALPTLKFGTVNDTVPKEWTYIDYPNLGNLYCGNMSFMTGDANFFPYSLPCEGRMDLLTVDGDIPRRRAIRMASAVKENVLFDQPECILRKVVGYRIIPKAKEGFISIDGESVPFEPFQVEVHQGLGTILSRFGGLYDKQQRLL